VQAIQRKVDLEQSVKALTAPLASPLMVLTEHQTPPDFVVALVGLALFALVLAEHMAQCLLALLEHQEECPGDWMEQLAEQAKV
jgi:hypothetical protein